MSEDMGIPDANDMLNDLAAPVQRLVNHSIAQLSDNARAMVAEALAKGATLCVMIELAPVFSAKLILDDGKRPVELAELKHQPQPN